MQKKCRIICIYAKKVVILHRKMCEKQKLLTKYILTHDLFERSTRNVRSG